MFVPLCLTGFSYSALVPAVSLYPRLESTLDCVTAFIFAEPYITDPVALLYHFLLLFSFSVNYCTLHPTYCVVDAKFRGLVG